VRDQGIGIAAENLEKIFARYKRVGERQAVPGLGLGLSIVQKIVAAHHGKVWAESKLGEGSCFRVLLPE
jgi:signal transduction histidine kinase